MVERMAQSERRSKVSRAAATIALLAVLFTIGGTISGFMVKSDADEALVLLSKRADDEVIRLPNGRGERTVASLREEVAAAPRLIFVTNYLLAAAMVGLCFWARKAPMPAILTALGVYLVVLIGNMIVDPKTLTQGIIMKVIAIGSLGRGVYAALAEQTYLRAKARDARNADSAEGAMA